MMFSDFLMTNTLNYTGLIDHSLFYRSFMNILQVKSSNLVLEW